MEGLLSAPDARRSDAGLPVLLGGLPDDELVALIARGSHAAFNAFYSRHYPGVRSLCRDLLGRADAEDAAQETFLSAYKQFVAGYRPDHTKAWLRAVARNCCLGALRRTHPAVGLIARSVEDCADEVERRLHLQELLSQVKQLPDRQRAALALSGVAGLPHWQIARVLDCDPAKVKSLVFDARVTLRAQRAREVPSPLVSEAPRSHVRELAGSARIRE